MYYFSCPKCGNDDAFCAPEKGEGEIDSTGCAIFAFGGFLPWAIYRSSQRERIQCARCGFLFRQPPLPSSPVAGAVTWLWILIPIAALVGWLVHVFGLESAEFPGHGLLVGMQETIERNAFGTAVAVLFLCVVATFVTAFISVLSNITHRRDIREEYETEPPEYMPRSDGD